MGEKKTTLLKKREFYYNINIIPRFFLFVSSTILWIIYRILCNQLIKYKLKRERNEKKIVKMKLNQV